MRTRAGRAAAALLAVAAWCGGGPGCGPEVRRVPGDTSELRLRLHPPPAQDPFEGVAELRLVLALPDGTSQEWRLDGSASEALVVGQPAAGVSLRLEGLDLDHQLVSSGQSAPFDLDPLVPVEVDLLFARAGEFAQLEGPLSQARFGHSAVPLGDGRVLIVGGAGAGDLDAPQALASPELYDPRLQSACTLGEAGCPVVGEGDRRFGQEACATADGDAFVFGGRDAGGQLVQRVLLYRHAEDSWLEVQGINPALVPPRTGHALAGLQVLNGETARDGILVAGGELDGGAVTGLAALFDVQTRSFTRTNLSLARPRSGLRAARLGAGGHRLVLVGGRDAAGLVAPVELFDGSNLGLIQPQGALTRDSLLTPRLRPGLAEVGGRVFVLGGDDGLLTKDDPEVVVLDVEEGSGVVPLHVAVVHADHVGRRGAVVAPLPSGAVLIAGGEVLNGFERQLQGTAEWMMRPELSVDVSFVGAGELGQPLSFPGVALLAGGGVLITGGLRVGDGGLEATGEVWYYNPR
ncbi:MAG TPA: hypothetical protein PK668_02065 [Myxococcota bacterium]|nr:hypothetical protein [Myxococcota bacterium]HRY94646.1 hypothetical protein [Myxococcota bacterium]HSA20592.1 hypothetical protein [Myxococcota bacterium]